METNPRVRVPGEWAPPPPVVVPESPQTPPPLPTQGPDQAEQFEDLLGGLVEHYATLPPANFGEPPDAIFETSDKTVDARRRSPVLWIALGVVGLTLAGLGAGGFYVYNKLKLNLDPSKIAADTTPAIKIAIDENNLPKQAPKVAVAPVVPKVEQLTPEAEPAAAAEPPKAASVAKARPARVVKKRARRTTRTSRRRVVERRSVRKPVRASSSENWEDPYK
jgi:hypothetical protein